jgi:hypothetical protein
MSAKKDTGLRLAATYLQRDKDGFLHCSLSVNTVTRAHEGADLAFVKGASGSVVTRESH